MTKKHVLQHAYEHHFKAIGITSPQKDYRMCWLLNNHIGIDLKRVSDFIYAPLGSDKELCFSVYHFEKPSMFLHINLLTNRSEEYSLFAQPKNIDFLLLYKNPSEQLKLEEALKSIRKISQIQAAYMLPNLHDKKASEFFFDFELFLAGK